MGCDIHSVFQAKQGGRWVDVLSEYDERRHYFLFAWLAGVRNGFGFAGIPTHDPVTPIAEPRDLPPGIAIKHNGKWLGDHSHSWLSADEILAAKRPAGVMRTGVVERKVFDGWDGRSQPDHFCGGISGGGVVVAASPAVVGPNTTHVTIEWPMPTTELDYFINEVKRLREKHGEVRFVFGFDS